MIAFLRDEPGADVVERHLAVEPPACLAHAVNLCEVFYDFLKRSGEDAARGALDDLRAVGLIVREDMDEAFWQQSGRHKVRYRMPLPDAFALSLADRFGAEVLTSDHRDFDSVAQSGVRRVMFIR
jgi:hypothetical protein